MNCKFCNAEMEDNHKFCPFCGKNQTEELSAETHSHTAVETEDMEDVIPLVKVAEETVSVCDNPEDFPMQTQEKEKKNPWPMALGITGAVLGLLALAIALLLALGVDFKDWFGDKEEPTASTQSQTEPTASTQSQTEPTDPSQPQAEMNDEASKAAIQKKDAVVATMGDKALTNTQLQIYYHMQLMEFFNYYGSYLSELGLDPTMPLSEQTCFYDETKTWEGFFLERAVETWQHYQAIGLLAEEAGYKLGDEWLESFNELPASLEQQAIAGGYQSTDEMLKDVVGPTCDSAAYMEYVKLAYIGNAYYGSLQEELTPNADEVDAYFHANEAVFTEKGITKTSGNVASVRHILLSPENPIVDAETQATTYAKEDWDKCLKAAEELLAQWKKGDATEASFAALVAENTEDGGSMDNGGLYEGISPTSSFVEPFRTWAVDMKRQTGDTGIVKTEFGYHIMYYVSGEPEWYTQAMTQLLAERMTEKTEAAEAKWPIETDYTKVALTAPNLGV